MNTTIETIPQQWDDERDARFFRLTAALFTPAFCHGAGVLLASYDPDDTVSLPTTPVASSYDVAPLVPVPTTTH